MIRYGVFASRWPIGARTIWTVVNRNNYDVGGRQLVIHREAGTRYFDLYHGGELLPEHEGNSDTLSFSIDAHSIAALEASTSELDKMTIARMARIENTHNHSVLQLRPIS